MVARRLPHHVWTVEQYLAYEHDMQAKHEFINGEVLAMAGGSRNHNKITASTMISVGSQIRGKGCQVYSSDQRVRISREHYTYPDITFVCGDPQFAEQDTLLNPTLVFEILSPSTRDFDRGEKAQRYRGLSSLQEYVLVEQDTAHVEVYTRLPDGGWKITEADGLEATIRLQSLDCTLSLSEVYEQVNFEDEEIP